jgi:hypothetical protein
MQMQRCRWMLWWDVRLVGHDFCTRRAHGAQARYSHDLSCREAQAGLRRKVSPVNGGYMRRIYRGLPAARSVEEAIVLAQLLIKRDLEQRAKQEALEDQSSPTHHTDLNAA